MRKASTWNEAALVLTRRVTTSPTWALTLSAYPSMSPAACGVVTHQASPGRAFSAMMAGEVGRLIPAMSVCRAVGGRAARVVVVDGRVGRGGGAASTLGVPEPAPSTPATGATAATATPAPAHRGDFRRG